VAGRVFDTGKRGQRVTFTLEDRSGRVEASMFEDVWQEYRGLIVKGAILVAEGSLRFDDYIEDWRLTVKRVLDIDQARERYGRRLVLRWPEEAGSADRRFVESLHETLQPFRGGRCRVAVRYRNAEARAEMELSDEWSVTPTLDLTERLSQLFGHDGLRLVYATKMDA